MSKIIWSYTKEAATVQRINCLEVQYTSREEGRPNKSMIKTVRNDLTSIKLSDKIAFDRNEWKHNNHVANPS